MYSLESGASWTDELKNAFKTGTTYASLIYNQQEYNESNFLKEAELKDVRYVPNAGFIGQAVSKMLTIKMVNNENSNLNFENADVQFKIGTIYNGIRYNINYGNFIVDEAPKNDATNGTVTFIAYDYMIKFNKDYTNRVIYPCTLKDLLLDVCSQAGVELGSSSFSNDSFIVENNQFEGKQLREVLQHIAKCAFSWARIGQDNKLYLDFSTTNDYAERITIDDYKTDSFKKANEYYGPVNKVTFGDSDIKGQEESVQDNASIQQNGLTEIKINDNYFAYTTEKRHELIQAGTSLFGLRYMPIQSLDLIGLIYLDCNDIIEVEDLEGNVFTSRVFSHIINYNGITSDNIATTGESDNEREYVNTNNSIAQNARTEIIVDRAKKEITAIVEEVGEQNQKIARVTQTVDELNSKISDIADITTSLESNSARLEFEGINQSEPIRVVIHPIGVNISKLYPNINLKPSSTLKIKTRILRFTNTTTSEIFEYELPDDLLYYDSENYDEFILDYDGLSCIVNKKCKWNNDGTVGLLANERTDEYTFPHIELTDGDYLVQLIQYSNGYIFARLMAQNIYTTQFATKAELNSEISQTVDNINLSVNERLTNYSTTTEMNSAIDLKANQITSNVSENYATKSELNSSTSSLNSKIDQTAQSISLTVDSVQEQVETAQSTADTATTKADNAQSSANSAQSTANSATTKANNAQTSANNAQATADSINTNLTTNYYTKTQTNSAINQKADSITSTVSQTYSTKTETTAAKNAAINSANASTDTKLQSYSTTTQMNTAIEQKANSITSSVSQTYSTKTETASAIDNIKIGGTNLLRFTQSGENWVKSSFNEQELTFTRETTSTGESFITHPKAYLALEKNTQYTLSAWIKSNGKVKSLDIWCYDKNTDHPQSKSNISVNTTWQFVTWTFTTNNYSNSDYSQTTIRFDNNGSTTQGQNAILYVKKPKLEIGNKATDWQPSSEDYSTTTQMNSAITQTANDINLEVSKKVGTNEIISKINQSAEAVQINANKISLNGKSINLTSGNITISSDKFSVDKNGNITATGGTIGGFGLSSNSFSKQLNGLYDYSMFDLCMQRLNFLDGIDLSSDPTLFNIIDYDNDGVSDSMDMLNILKVIKNLITNTKVEEGFFEINANNPKNCLTIKDESENTCVSIGIGGVNSNIVITKNIICTNTESENSNIPYVSIDGINGQISLNQNTNAGPASTRINYEGITTPTVTQTSLESEKKNFEKYENALEILKNIDIYKYNLKSEEDDTKKHIGFVIGDNYKYSEEVTSKNNDGVDVYSFVSLCCKAIQEQQKQIEELQKEIKELKGGK